MADIVVKAAYASVVEDEGRVFVGFAEGEDEEEAYVLFAQDQDGGPVWFELGDEAFGAEDALEQVTLGAKGLEIAIRPEMAAKFGWARTVAVRLAGCEDVEEALDELRRMLGPVMVEAP